MRRNIGLTQNNGTWAYTRTIPRAFKHHPTFQGKANYRVQLGPSTLTDEQLSEKYSKAHNSFERFVSSLKQENQSVLEKNELIRQAEAFLEVNKLQKGMLAPDDKLTKSDNQTFIATQYRMLEQSGVFEELEEYSAREAYQEQVAQENYNQRPSNIQIQEFAWKLLTEPATSNIKSHLISEAWSIYATHKGLDESLHEPRRLKAIFYKFVEIVGDQIFDEDTLDSALVSYVDTREHERDHSLKEKGKASPLPSTIERELNTILAALRVTIKKLRLKMKLERPQVRQDLKSKERHTFTAQQQLEAVKLFSNKSRTDYQPYKELLALIMVQSGTHISELIRLTNDRVKLNANIPHIILDGELKTKQRRRIIPLVYKLDRIKELAVQIAGETCLFGDNLPARQAENYSTLMNRICKQVHIDATTYSFRHSFKHHAMAHGVDAQLLAILGGWSGKELGLSRQMQGYGASGMLQQDSLKRLQDAMITINRHLIDDERPSNGSEGPFNLLYLRQ